MPGPHSSQPEARLRARYLPLRRFKLTLRPPLVAAAGLLGVKRPRRSAAAASVRIAAMAGNGHAEELLDEANTALTGFRPCGGVANMHRLAQLTT